MARITPKLNWISSDVPWPSDFIRIENNNKQAFDEIDANEAQRDIDEAALQANIDAEALARSSADNDEATTRSNADIAEAAARLAGDAGYSGSSDITDYPIGSIIVAKSSIKYNRNTTVGPSRSVSGSFTLEAAPSDLAGTWKARGVIEAGGDNYILCQRIS